jgi:hypothetical protein
MYVCRAQGNKEDDEEMKPRRTRTLRGQLEVIPAALDARRNLIAADGLINMGLRITRFQIWAVDPANPFIGILSYETIPTGTGMDASDNRQFGWTVGNGTGDLNPEYLDPDHIINRDMFLSLVLTAPGVYNYLIEMQVYELTDDEAIISIIKETSQS